MCGVPGRSWLRTPPPLGSADRGRYRRLEVLASARRLKVFRAVSAEPQPGQPPCRSGQTSALAAWHPGPPGLEEQPVPLAGPPCVVLASLHEEFVDGHGLLPDRGWRSRPPGWFHHRQRPGSSPHVMAHAIAHTVGADPAAAVTIGRRPQIGQHLRSAGQAAADRIWRRSTVPGTARLVLAGDHGHA